MTEHEWLTSEDPAEMLRFLPDDFSRRKLRHFVCDCVRRDLPATISAEVSRILDFANQIADDERNIDGEEWVVIHQDLRESCRNGSYAPDDLAASLIFAVGDDVYDDARWFVDGGSETQNELATTLLRCIFGNPFRPVAFDAEWRSDNALSLARHIYEARDFSTMPILADALQDAGCTHVDILNHCRDANAVHARGCWVVDMVLGKA